MKTLAKNFVKYALPALFFGAGVAVAAKATFKNNVVLPEVLKQRFELTKFIGKNDLLDYAYNVRWKVKEKQYQGPLAAEGEFFVLGMNAKDPAFQKWVTEVAPKTIGLGVDGIPSENPHTAVLRVGTKLYPFDAIQTQVNPQDLSNPNSSGYLENWTEATFRVSAAEIKAIEKFLSERRQKHILSKKRYSRYGIEIGHILDPQFDEEKMTLAMESCAGAVSSFFNPIWWEHYDGSEALQKLAERLQINPTHVARRLVWENSRNPNLLSITMVGQRHYSEHITVPENLIKNNKWGNLRGLPVYGIIPDTSNDSKTIESVREDLVSWAKRNGAK